MNATLARIADRIDRGITDHTDADALRAALAQQIAQPVARLLRWVGPAHYSIPHGGFAARTYAEFSAEASAKPDSYWRDDAPLYTAQQAAPAHGIGDAA